MKTNFEDLEKAVLAQGEPEDFSGVSTPTLLAAGSGKQKALPAKGSDYGKNGRLK